jgi:hypothetical protein
MTIIRLKGATPTEQEFSTALSEFFRTLKRYVPGLEYLCVNEWTKRKGFRHAHALLIAPNGFESGQSQRAGKLAGLRVRSCTPIRKLVGSVNYIFKHTRNLNKKARLAPSEFKGNLCTHSRGFLSMGLKKLCKKLWREYRSEHQGPENTPH